MALYRSDQFTAPRRAGLFDVETGFRGKWKLIRLHGVENEDFKVVDVSVHLPRQRQLRANAIRDLLVRLDQLQVDGTGYDAVQIRGDWNEVPAAVAAALGGDYTLTFAQRDAVAGQGRVIDNVASTEAFTVRRKRIMAPHHFHHRPIHATYELEQD
jgi:hypothetical protein